MSDKPDKDKDAGTERKKKLRLYIDEAKLRHTGHWDSDFMSREEFDAYMRGKDVPRLKQECDEDAARPWEEDEQTPRACGRISGRPMTAWERFLKAILPRR